MIDENIQEYMEKVHILNKELAEYVNEETGVKYIIPTAHLLVRIEYIEATKSELDKLLFNSAIDKLEYKSRMGKRPVVKSTITKDKKDDYTLVDSEIKLYDIWNVTNGLKIKQSFNNKEEAIKLYDEVNKKILDAMEV